VTVIHNYYIIEIGEDIRIVIFFYQTKKGFIVHIFEKGDRG